MMKRFFEWIGLKEKLHTAEHVPPLFKEHEIWWCSIKEKMGELDASDALRIGEAFLALHALKNRPSAVAGGGRGLPQI